MSLLLHLPPILGLALARGLRHAGALWPGLRQAPSLVPWRAAVLLVVFDAGPRRAAPRRAGPAAWCSPPSPEAAWRLACGPQTTALVLQAASEADAGAALDWLQRW
ncbi:MAG: hypothetical protein KGJ24_07685, partial [Burkholderiales bacterium]|nr:hypothetical protein [Burkholderiales bacterium]